MRSTASLSHLVDLALGTPEIGAVNFNVLHTLLHALLQKLELSDSKTVISEEDKEFLVRKHNEYETATEDGKSVADSGIDGVERDASQTGKNVATPVAKPPYHQLEDKVARIEAQFQALNSLPSNSDLFDKTKSYGDGERQRPIADMWQMMQLTKRVDANEEGVGKVSDFISTHRPSSSSYFDI